MEDVTIYTASSVPGAASHPTLNCLQWTGDGQLLFSTKYFVYILTPDLGLNNRGPSAVRASTYRNGSPHENPCGWFKTVLELDKRSFYHWPSDSQDWDSLVTGSLDVSIKSVVVSPSFLSADAGCVLAIVSTNLELSLWCSVKNEPVGQWIKLQDATPFLRSLAAIHRGSHHEQTLRAQVLCSSWSTQPDFGASPAYVSDSSLLALGNKAGSVLLLSFSKEQGSDRHLEHVQTVDVSEQWVTHLTWLPWTREGTDECAALLIYCTSGGAVGLVKVSRMWRTRAGTCKPALATRANHLDSSICEADDRIVMGLTFIEPRNMKPIVVLLRPGIVQLWNEQDDRGTWSGLRTFQLRRQAVSSGSSMFYPPSGLIYSPERDAVFLSLFDGSFHVIYNVSFSPTVTPPNGAAEQDNFTSSNLSSMSRKVFVQVEGGAVPHVEMNRISGMVSFAGFPIVCWTHERSMSSDFSYKHEARHSSILVVTKMHTEDGDNAILRMLTEAVSTAKAFSGTAPTHILYPLLFRLGRDGVLTRLHPRILQALHSPVADDCLELILSPQLSEPSSSAYGEFCESATRRLFGNDTLLQLRLMLAIANFCWELAPSPEMRSEYGEVARYLLNIISHRILRVFVRLIDCVVPFLTRGDILFVLRVVIQCMLPGTPQELSVEAQTLADKVTSSFPTSEGAPGGLLEQCPACGVEIPLADTASAVCSNGHRWSRCSATSFILAGTMVRTCLGCARKAFLPAARSLHRSERGGDATTGAGASTEGTAEDPIIAEDLDIEHRSGWLVQELLKAVRRCLFCGNNFATLI
ncbi:putative zinc-finger of transcription factor IIIC complex-domain-containing protein [Lactarius psammicola]|nr:putative zinc-finger of transcription factor IIIC complex-domain-containing protein [Lactarius psammicola]